MTRMTNTGIIRKAVCGPSIAMVCYYTFVTLAHVWGMCGILQSIEELRYLSLWVACVACGVSMQITLHVATEVLSQYSIAILCLLRTCVVQQVDILAHIE